MKPVCCSCHQHDPLSAGTPLTAESLELDAHVAEAARHHPAPQALTIVDAALDSDPHVERAWRLRMRVLGLLGDYDCGIAAFGDCRNALAAIGLEPSAATTALAHRLRR